MEAFWALLMPLIIVGGIISGFFTATESAVVAVVYALLVRLFIYRDLKWEELPNHCVQAGIVTSVVLFLMGMASIVAWIITINNIPTLLVASLKSITSNPDILLFLIVILLSIAGCFIDSASNIVMFAPILAPLAAAFGIHPIHFGIVVIVTLMLGMITPPVGVILFVASGISGEKFEVIVRNIIPFLYSSAVVLILMVLFPKLVIFIPSLFGY
jgi:C4-dicarboxylate transporter DctM subunit